MIRSMVVTLMMLVTVSATCLGQNRPGKKAPDPGPIGTLLQLRAELGLTEAQVARLAEIEAEVDRQNERPLAELMQIRQQMRALGPRHQLDGERRAQYEAHMAAMRPLARQLEENMDAALQQVRSQLTESQRRQVWRILQQRDRNRDRNGNSPRPPSPGN